MADVPGFPRVLFVHQGTSEDAGPVFEEFWPEARAVSDPDLVLYRAFGIGRGKLGQLLSPGLVARAFRARRKGFSQGKTQGDPRLMPGAFLVMDNRVVWAHDYGHAGDTPDFAALAQGEEFKITRS